MSALTDSVFEIISDPAGIKLSLEINPRIFKRVVLKDTLLKFYPMAEVVINDQSSIIASSYPFIEGMKFSTKLGMPEYSLEDGTTFGGYLVHDYAWSEDQINTTKRDSEYISGNNNLILISNCFFKDYKKATAYQSQPSVIASTIASDVYGISTEDQIIDDTTNDDSNIWYQGNRTHRDFIEQTLVKKAYSSSLNQHDKTSFISFINCLGEFYFCSFDTLYNQTPVATYECTLKLGKVIDPFSVQEIVFATGGAPLNKKNYNQEIYYLDESGESIIDTVTMSDKFLTTSNLDKFPVNKNNINQINDINNFGLFETGEEYFRTSEQSFLYQNSNIAFRAEIVIHFNPQCVSGRVVELKIKSSIDDEYSTQLSGNWLIVESEHFKDQDDVIFSHLTVARPSLPFPNNWPYLNNIIS